MRAPREKALAGETLRGVDPTGTMKIGEVAVRLGLSLRSIRYYEETGLVTPSSRTAGGFRLYSELDVQRLLLIMQMKPLEFTLEEMGQVLADLDALQGEGTPAPERAQARSRLVAITDEVEDRWTSLRRRLDIADSFRAHLAHELEATAEG